MEFPLQTSTYWKESLLSLLEKLSRTFNSRSWKAQRYLKEKAAILEKREPNGSLRQCLPAMQVMHEIEKNMTE